MKIVAVTACTTGIAHTYMAAESLELYAKELGYDIKVETQGTSGTENILTQEEINKADAIILAVDKKIDETRFSGKDVLRVNAAEAIKNPEEVFEKALSKEGVTTVARTDSEDMFSSVNVGGILQHIMNGVSYMIPLVVAGGILISLSFAFGIYAAEVEGSIAWALNLIGGGTAFALMVPITAGFIAQSIANNSKAAFAAGAVGGMLSDGIEAGFLGGIIAGVLAGYITLYLSKYIKVPQSLNGLKAIVVVPVLSVAIIGLLMLFVIGAPLQAATGWVNNFLESLTGGSIVILGLFFGLIYFDLGGPFSKIVYTFGLSAYAAGNYVPMGAAMICGMIPPLGIALATFVKPNYWTKAERESGKAAIVLGLSFITEGAIPFAATNPLAVIPASMIGSAVGSIAAFLLEVGVQAPHGGFFLLLIPNAVTNIIGFIIALGAGTLATTIALLLIMKYQTRAKATE